MSESSFTTDFLKKSKKTVKNKNCSFCSESSFYTNNGVSVGTHIAFITSFESVRSHLSQKIGGSKFLLLKDIAGKGMSLSEK